VTEQQIDTNGDGQIDAIVVDVNENGVADGVALLDPGTGEWTPYLDTDEDGQFEQAEFPQEEQPNDGDGGPVDDGNGGPVDDGNGVPLDGGYDGGLPADDAPIDQDSQDRSDYEGQFWQQQTQNGYCAPTSVAIVVSEMLGEPLDAQLFVDRTMELGIMHGEPGAWQGITANETEQLFESFGIPATVVEPGSASDAWEQLGVLTNDTNHGVIAYIDSSEVWDGVDDDFGKQEGEGLKLDHAVVVTHVDDDYVYLNDPGTPNGQQLRVPRDEFMDAWDDSNHTMVVTDSPVPIPAADPQPTEQEVVDGQTPWAPGQPGLGGAAQASFLGDQLAGRRVAMLPVVLPSSAASLVAVDS
jgi:hypothetical protein